MLPMLYKLFAPPVALEKNSPDGPLLAESEGALAGPAPVDDPPEHADRTPTRNSEDPGPESNGGSGGA
jgi:hypothetical protein